MKLIHGYSETEAALNSIQSALSVIKNRPTTEKGLHTVTAAELDQLNKTHQLAVEFMKRVKDISKERVHESIRLQEKIWETLDAQQKPYIYATSTYCKENLAQFDDYTASSIKRILREYFTPLGMKYEGWN